ncbi:hypothetical protein [Caballeronia zhejiangensis]|uniref:hypothetical protein n=1 Tax=Caballeronia zhejiangensis TaxID=871203 RepID=UPI001F51FC7A|nr:hypothetical protein [Caballeronia zhejiangensis]MCI1046939.1 hypothetical protein [Caballeronia zhejiangensis]
MSKTYWVTLRNIPNMGVIRDELNDWLAENTNSSYTRNAGYNRTNDGPASLYCSFCFPNDFDAMVFKLTFSHYI